MKPIYIKYSDERNKRSSICTRILEDNEGFRQVTKEAIWPEGQAHIDDMLHFYDVIRDSYEGILPSPVSIKEKKAVFPYLTGVSLESRYRAAFAKKDKKRFEDLLKKHAEIIVGKNKTLMDFPILPRSDGEELNDTEKFWTVFGDPSPYAGSKALGKLNFDAIAGNIMEYREDLYFLDYEWVIEFPVPVDLALGHAIGNLWLHMEGLEEFYPLADALQFVGVTASVETIRASYMNWWYSIIRDDGRLGFADQKNISVKGHFTIEDLIRDKEEAVKSMDFAGQNWKATDAELMRVSDELKAKEQKFALEYQQMTADRDAWRGHYYDVVNSKTWRTVQKAKKIIKKS